jgi:hypothetical protein
MFTSLVKTTAPWLLVLSLVASLAACGGGGSDPAPAEPAPPPPVPTATLSLAASSASVVAGASTTITANVVRGGGFVGAVTVAATGAPAGVSVTGGVIAAGSTSATLNVTTTTGAAAATNNLSITATGTGVTVAPAAFALTVTAPVVVVPVTLLGAQMQGEVAGDSLGYSMAMSADGTRVIFGAPYNSGTGLSAGHARVFQLSAGTWTQLGSDIDGEAAGDLAGFSVSMSASGNRVAVGALHNFGPTGLRTNAGHVRVHDLVGGVWTQVGSDIDAPTSGVPATGSQLGTSVSLSGDGQRLVVGAANSLSVEGFVVAYQLVNGNWEQMGSILSATGSIDFGRSVDFSEDGSTIAIGVPGVRGFDRPGSTYVYRWNGTAWAALGSVIAGEANRDFAGGSVALSANGSRLAIGAAYNRGKDVTPGTTGLVAGQVRVYELSATSTWVQLGADIDGNNDEFSGDSVDISRDGKRIVVGVPNASAARVYVEAGGVWTQFGVDLKVTGGVRADSVAISADGLTAAVGFTNSNFGKGLGQAYRLAP